MQALPVHIVYDRRRNRLFSYGLVTNNRLLSINRLLVITNHIGIEFFCSFSVLIACLVEDTDMNYLLLRSASRLLKNTSCVCSTIFRTEYESAYSLKKLYPNSNVEITTPLEKEIVQKSTQKFCGYIPVEKLIITASRSSGPGGQHVNKTNTKVEVRFHLETADWIPEDLRKRLLEIKKNNLTKEGYMIIRSDKTRSQQMNLADVLHRIRHIIYKCEDTVIEPDPEHEATIRKRKERANELRLKEKRHRIFLNRLKKCDE